jgi:hypothetical protein
MPQINKKYEKRLTNRCLHVLHLLATGCRHEEDAHQRLKSFKKVGSP